MARNKQNEIFTPASFVGAEVVSFSDGKLTIEISLSGTGEFSEKGNEKLGHSGGWVKGTAICDSPEMDGVSLSFIAMRKPEKEGKAEKPAPVRQVAAPARQAAPPRKATPPARQAAAPVRQAAPARKVAPPARQVAAPARQAAARKGSEVISMAERRRQPKGAY